MSAVDAVVGDGGEVRGGRPVWPWSNVSIKVPDDVEAMDEAGVEIGSEELPRGGVENDVAQAGAAISGDRGEERHGAGLAVDFPYAAGTGRPSPGRIGRPSIRRSASPDFHAFGRPLPSESGSHDLKAEGRGGAKIDVG